MHQAQGGFGAVDGSTGCPELIRQSRLALAEVDLARVHAALLALRFSFSFSFFLSLSASSSPAFSYAILPVEALKGKGRHLRRDPGLI